MAGIGRHENSVLVMQGGPDMRYACGSFRPQTPRSIGICLYTLATLSLVLSTRKDFADHQGVINIMVHLWSPSGHLGFHEATGRNMGQGRMQSAELPKHIAAILGSKTNKG